jgi:hypothetical protein
MTFHETSATLFHETYTYLNLIKHMDISNVQTSQQVRLSSREKTGYMYPGFNWLDKKKAFMYKVTHLMRNHT